MRILCLHGYGTSAAIFRRQLHALITYADPSYEFVFLNGEYECPPAQGLGLSESTPALCFNKAFGPDEIESSLDHLDDFVKSEGPFDGILGFSQGGSLALSYMLRDAESSSSAQTSAPPPFKFAILLSTIVAFSPKQDFASDLINTLTTADLKILQGFPHCTESRDYSSMSHPPQRALYFEALGLVLDRSLSGGFIAPDTDLGLDALEALAKQAVSSQSASDESSVATQDKEFSRMPRLIHPSLLPAALRIPIPTVHVTGRRDNPALVSLSQLMERICTPDLLRRLTHDGAHDVPRSPRDVRSLLAAIEWAAEESQRLLW